MKTKFNNSELTHVWANQSQTEGTGSNIFFDGPSIYSYGRHFKIAEIVEHNNKTAVLFNSDSYSNTTAKHQSLTLRSIPSQYPIFKVVSFGNNLHTHRDNLGKYLTDAENTQRQTKTATKHKGGYLSQTIGHLNTFRNYCSFFDLGDYSNMSSMTLQGLSISERYILLTEWVNLYENSTEFKEWQIKQEENKKKAELKAIEEAKDKIDLFRAFKVPYIYNLGINLLRFNKDTDEIETSGGVKMPRNIFFDAYQRLKNDTLLIGQHIGQYRFNGLENDTLLIGCHKVPLNEVANIIPILG